MKIETIDIYWAKLPLAFVWKTSYADQHYTDTILVRMEGGGHYAWGRAARPISPGTPPITPWPPFTPCASTWRPRSSGRTSSRPTDLLDRIAFVKGNQFARAALEITWWVLDAKRRGLPCTGRSAGHGSGWR